MTSKCLPGLSSENMGDDCLAFPKGKPYYPFYCASFSRFFSLFVITFTNTVQVFTALELNCGYFSNEFHPLRVRTEWPWHLAGSEVLVAICECTPFSYRVVKSREIFLALSWTAKKKTCTCKGFT